MNGIRNVDRWMLASLVALLAIGITMVLNTSYLFAQERFGDGTYLFRKQLLAAGLGLLGLSVALLLPPPAYRRLAGPLLVAALVAAGAGADSGCRRGPGRRPSLAGSVAVPVPAVGGGQGVLRALPGLYPLQKGRPVGRLRIPAFCLRCW